MYTMLYTYRHMKSKVVPLRLEEEVLKAVDMLVKLGVYKSRNEALRSLVKKGLENTQEIKAVAEAVRKLFEIEELEGMPVKLEGVLTKFLEERERI